MVSERDKKTFFESSDQTQTFIKDLLKNNNCWDVLWEEDNLPIYDNFESDLPFRAESKMIGIYE